MIDPSHPDPVRGFFGACLALLVAFAPGWVAWHTAVDFFAGEIDRESYLLATGVFLGSIALLAFLIRIAYRMFTGRSRRKDGGLVGPYVLGLFSLMVLCMSAFAIWGLLADREWKFVVPALIFGVMGLGGIRLAIKRVSNAN